MDKVIKNKRVLELVTSHSSGYEVKFTNISLLVMYYLANSDGVI